MKFIPKLSKSIVKYYKKEFLKCLFPKTIPFLHSQARVIAKEVVKYSTDRRRAKNTKVNFVEEKLREYYRWCLENDKPVYWTRCLPLKKKRSKK